MSVQITFEIDDREWLDVMAKVYALRETGMLESGLLFDFYDAVEMVEAINTRMANTIAITGGSVEDAFLRRVADAVDFYKKNNPHHKS